MKSNIKFGIVVPIEYVIGGYGLIAGAPIIARISCILCFVWGTYVFVGSIYAFFTPLPAIAANGYVNDQYRAMYGTPIPDPKLVAKAKKERAIKRAMEMYNQTIDNIKNRKEAEKRAWQRRYNAGMTKLSFEQYWKGYKNRNHISKLVAKTRKERAIKRAMEMYSQIIYDIRTGRIRK